MTACHWKKGVNPFVAALALLDGAAGTNGVVALADGEGAGLGLLGSVTRRGSSPSATIVTVSSRD